MSLFSLSSWLLITIPAVNARTRRILTVAMLHYFAGRGGKTPSLLNFLTGDNRISGYHPRAYYFSQCWACWRPKTKPKSESSRKIETGFHPTTALKMSIYTQGKPEVLCCVIEEGERCRMPATPNSTFNKKLLKNVSQKRQRYSSDPEVSY